MRAMRFIWWWDQIKLWNEKNKLKTVGQKLIKEEKINNGMHKKRPLSAINVELSAELNSEVLHFSIHLKEM